MTLNDDTVRVDPDLLLRAGAALVEVGGAVSREVPTSAGLTIGPVGWSVRRAVAHVNHSVHRHLLGISEDLIHNGDGLRKAATNYREFEQESVRRTRQIGRAG